MIRILAGVVILGLAGCVAGVGGGSYYAFQMTALYSWRQLGYVQSQGPVPIVVHGNPFPGVPAEPFARNVAAAMTGANAGPPLRFTIDPPAPTRQANYYVVVVFGSGWVGGSDLCQVKRPEVQPSGPRVHAEAAFCIDERRISEIKGDMAAEASGPDDPNFIAFMRGLTANLMPLRDAVNEQRRCSPGMLC